MELPENVDYILSRLNKAGYEAYVVGGAIRSLLLNTQPNDWDIATSALPNQIKEVFSNNRTIDTGIKHGTVTVVVDGVNIEVTTYRTDGEYTDGRRPDSVEFVDDIKEDLARRDFTMNAIAYSPRNGFVDPYNGMKDIEVNIIKCVGSPSSRFQEDALRIMRAMRFSAQLEFDIEEQTSSAMRNFKNLLGNISKERIQNELCKILLSNNCGSSVLRNYPDILTVVIPSIKHIIPMFVSRHSHIEYDAWECILRSMEYFDEFSVTKPQVRSSSFPIKPEFHGDDIITRLAVLLHDISTPYCEPGGDHADMSAKMAYRILRDLKFSNEIVGYTTQLISYHETHLLNGDKTNVKRLLNQIGEDQLKRLIRLRSAILLYGTKFKTRVHKAWCDLKMSEFYLDEMLINEECYSLKQLAINGDDLIECGIPSGEKIGFVLNYLLNMVISGNLDNDKETLLNMVECIMNFSSLLDDDTNSDS